MAITTRSGYVLLTSLLQAGGLKDIDSYRLLYEGQFQKSVPDGVDPGMLTNYTSDLLFSMERLSVNPFVVKRAQAQDSALPFTVPDDVVAKVVGKDVTFASLQSTGALFYVDHSKQKQLSRQNVVDPTRLTGFCSALFYLILLRRISFRS